jgi:hypothetical protein
MALAGTIEQIRRRELAQSAPLLSDQPSAGVRLPMRKGSRKSAFGLRPHLLIACHLHHGSTRIVA